jgi:undecaprenyl pyrophosphate phosphatase UppP
MFYLFAILLSLGRITQHSLSFTFLVNQLLRTLNNINDGFSICIGISQIIVITEIVFSMQLFQTEINSMDPQQLQKAHEGKNSKVKKLHIIAVCCVLFTILELLSRLKLHDYTVGEWIFVFELVLVAVFMLYYTYKFIQLVNEVQRTLGIEFCDEKN